MTHALIGKFRPQQIGAIFGLLCLYVQSCFANEPWQIIVLPDTNYRTPLELPPLADLHSAISQGLTTALSKDDFDVLHGPYLGLANCIIEDCSQLTDNRIKRAALSSGKEVNLALLYQLTAYSQRQSHSQYWHFSLSGRLLDLQTSIQQDSFEVDSLVPLPLQDCINECLTSWLNQHLQLLAQDLGAVLSEKLNAFPRRFRYLLNLHQFSSTELQRIDQYLKQLDGYVADTLLADTLSNSAERPAKINRSYQYTSELTASQLSLKLEQLDQFSSQSLHFEYDNTTRRFDLTTQSLESWTANLQNSAPWTTMTTFFSALFSNPSLEPDPTPQPETTNTHSAAVEMTEAVVEKEETEQHKQSRRELQTWQQATSVNTLQAYQQYLNVWPQGQHAILAQAAVNSFQDDENQWQQARRQNDSQAYQTYLNTKLDGKYRQQAKQQLAVLREQQQLRQKKQQINTLADKFYFQEKDY
ncbi:sel1 repeat family protein [Paraglaciecola aquimarina]|uniref:Sel1 repeat family protein n=1 Tax=Paraglaciecola aquimarina TaxID=1235557 RepID=A0ABU3T299_9ALTE|nr:sel1 repeat family protein [Paraglaciecola aquimarina]MDU0356394.1 sel1 repeat family protein [Paraglaciecola aquimarina]